MNPSIIEMNTMGNLSLDILYQGVFLGTGHTQQVTQTTQPAPPLYSLRNMNFLAHVPQKTVCAPQEIEMDRKLISPLIVVGSGHGARPECDSCDGNTHTLKRLVSTEISCFAGK